MGPRDGLQESKAESNAIIEDELRSHGEKVERRRHGGYGGGKVWGVEELEEGNAGLHGARGRWDTEVDLANGVVLGVGVLPSVGQKRGEVLAAEEGMGVEVENDVVLRLGGGGG